MGRKQKTVYVCDECGKEADGHHDELPHGWYAIEHRAERKSELVEPIYVKHLCSLDCARDSLV